MTAPAQGGHVAPGAPRFRQGLILAAWFGLVSGLVEGAGLLAFQWLGWLNWNMALMGVSVEIIWISAVFNLLLFGIVASVLGLATRMTPRLPLLHLTVFVLAWMAFLDWLLLSGRLRHSACLVLAAGLATAFMRWFRKHEAQALHFGRRTLPWVAATASLALMGIEGGIWLREWWAIRQLRAAPPGSPNILVVVVDSLRADHVASYGYPRATTPHLDRLAQQGVQFENAFATSSWSLPSHTSLLTGLFPYQHGAVKNEYAGRELTLAEALLARGYRTGAFSANTFFFCRRVGLGRGFIRFEDYFHSPGDMVARTLYGRKVEQHVLGRLGYDELPWRRSAPDINRAVLRWIERDREKPFLAFLNYVETHDPYLPPQPFRSKFSKVKNPGGILNSRLGRYYPKMTPEQLQSEMDAYDGAIVYVDEQIGQLLAALEQRGLDKNTLVILTSDHGESFGEHGLLIHQNALYREVIRVPLIFRWPGKLPAGVRVAQPVSSAALPATAMELLGGSEPRLFHGPSLVPLWTRPEARSDWPYPLCELSQLPFEAIKKSPAYHGSMKSLVSPQWHYIVHEKFGEELYDWRKDPEELNNLVQTPDGRRVADEFQSHLHSLLARGEARKGASPGLGR